MTIFFGVLIVPMVLVAASVAYGPAFTREKLPVDRVKSYRSIKIVEGLETRQLVAASARSRTGVSRKSNFTQSKKAFATFAEDGTSTVEDPNPAYNNALSPRSRGGSFASGGFYGDTRAAIAARRNTSGLPSERTHDNEWASGVSLPPVDDLEEVSGGSGIGGMTSVEVSGSSSAAKPRRSVGFTPVTSPTASNHRLPPAPASQRVSSMRTALASGAVSSDVAASTLPGLPTPVFATASLKHQCCSASRVHSRREDPSRSPPISRGASCDRVSGSCGHLVGPPRRWIHPRRERVPTHHCHVPRTLEDSPTFRPYPPRPHRLSSTRALCALRVLQVLALHAPEPVGVAPATNLRIAKGFVCATATRAPASPPASVKSPRMLIGAPASPPASPKSPRMIDPPPVDPRASSFTSLPSAPSMRRLRRPASST